MGFPFLLHSRFLLLVWCSFRPKHRHFYLRNPRPWLAQPSCEAGAILSGGGHSHPPLAAVGTVGMRPQDQDMRDKTNFFVFCDSPLLPNVLGTLPATSVAHLLPNLWSTWGRDHWIKFHILDRAIDFFISSRRKVTYSDFKTPITHVVLSSIAKHQLCQGLERKGE